MSVTSIAQPVWDKIPAPIRSVVNVGVGAAITAGAQYVLSIKGVPTDWSLVQSGLLTAVTTAFFRAVNPLDPAYGTSASNGEPYVPDLVAQADEDPAVDPDADLSLDAVVEDPAADPAAEDPAAVSQ